MRIAEFSLLTVFSFDSVSSTAGKACNNYSNVT